MIYNSLESTENSAGGNVLSVSELTQCIRGVIEAEDLFRDVWVRGEISNFVRHSSGHRYFSLKDASALIKCVIWNGSRNVKFDLSDGMRVVARGRVSVYEKQGQYQLTVNEIIPDGAGALFLAYEQLKAKLQAEGVFDSALKKPLPRFPRTVAIVTSPTAAALRDMVIVARRRMPSVNLVLVPALMQGAGSEASVVEALGLADLSSGADVIVLGRGGGSIEDLWTFNSESVVRAIRGCRIPVVSAIGHETDISLADFAADVRAATPSNAMELIIPDRNETEARIIGLLQGMRTSLESRIASRRMVLDHLSKSSGMRFPERMIQDRSQSVDLLTERMMRAYGNAVTLRQRRLSEAVAKVHSLSPLAVLARGYALVRRDADGRVVRNIGDVSKGDITETLVGDGRLMSEIIEVKEGWD